MRYFRAVAVLALLCSVFVTQSVAYAQPDAFAKATGKKLIEYGWDRPFPEFVRNHINAMEKQPFEGVIMKLPYNGGNVFNPKNWDKNQSKLQGQLKVLSEIKWNKFTDNFIAMYAASDMDWYSDADWKRIQANVRFVAEAGAKAKCVGLMFDPEPYGSNPWHYPTQKQKDKYSYAQYSAKVYQRGQQFMQAIQSEMPTVKLIMLHGYSMFYSYNHSPDQQTRNASYSQQNYGLFLSFWNGMLDAANPGTRLIDGNESSYYYQSPDDFYKAYWRMRQGSRINVPESLKLKFDAQERAANALYPDHLFALRPGVNIISNYMTPEQRKNWLEQNVYYALKTSDQYVWFYGQHMNWWAQKGDNPGIMSAKETPGVPPAIKEAVVSARTKLMNGQDLGFDMKDAFKEAQQKQQKALEDKLKRRSAKLPQLKANQVPRIDGKLDEKIYQQLPWLDPFVGYFNDKKPVKIEANTKAFVAYDSKNLYISLRCDEPDIKDLNISGEKHHDALPSADYIDIGIVKPGQPTDDGNAIYYHFILGSNNAHFDAINTGTTASLGYDPIWQSATAKDANGWTAEIAIPWQELGVKDAHSGLKIHANLARKRVPDKKEYSSWSQLVSGFQTPQFFGTWILG